jgi:hypothetical protein
MRLESLLGTRRDPRSRRIERAKRVLAKAAPVLCEDLEGRLLMSVSSWVVTWTGNITPSSATLIPGDRPGRVQVQLNTDPPGSPSHTFMNQTGQDLILLGSLTNFTVIDKVPAALKPQHDTHRRQPPE